MSSRTINASYILLVIAAVYSLILFVDIICRYCWRVNYILWLNNVGLEIKLFQIKWYNSGKISRLFSRIGMWRPHFLKIWFIVGAYVGALLLIPSMVLLVKTLIDNISTTSASNISDRIVLQPVLPGVNMPLSDLGYYFVALMICSIIHEAGHAIAAVNEDLRVLGFGMSIFFVLPVAYVNFPTDRLLSLRPYQQLRVFTAGIWHNVVLTGLGYLLLVSIPVLSSPWYQMNEGITLYEIESDSSLSLGPSSLNPYDIVTDVNDCRVRNKTDWRNCIAKSIINPPISYCMDIQDIQIVRDGSISENCCNDEEERNGALCFSDKLKGARVCLPVRTALETNKLSICGNSTIAEICPYYCLSPVIQNSNRSRLIQLKRRHCKDFLFVGDPSEIYYNTETTNYVYKNPNYRALLLLPPRLELLCHYLASFSGALAVLNVVPCFLLDGQHMTRVLVDILFSCYNSYIRTIITLTLTIVGTILLILNILVGIYQLL